MRQELGETTEEMMKADDQAVQDILNDRPRGHYWIVIHHKNINRRLTTGEQIFMRVVKAYEMKPTPQVGMVILEVKDGEIIDHIISPHDAPIDWEQVNRYSGLESNPTVFEKHPISGSYVYNK